VTLRKLALPLFVAALCLAQANWQAVTDLPGVDWKGLVGPKKTAALRVMQSEGCNCGCNLKIAECRVKDSACGVSRNLAGVVVKATVEGKTPQAIKAELDRVASEGPPVLDVDAVNISTAGDPVLGPANAKITIVEFSDFQCPYCSKAVPQVKEILRQMPNVRLVFKQFPLESHSQAEFGAEVALAAQAQGKFWEMHDLLYAGFPDLTRNRINSYARQLNLDMKRFTAEVDGHKYRARVDAEEKEGEAAGVDGTPKFFFNGRRYNGVFDAKTVVALLRKEFK